MQRRARAQSALRQGREVFREGPAQAGESSEEKGSLRRTQAGRREGRGGKGGRLRGSEQSRASREEGLRAQPGGEQGFEGGEGGNRLPHRRAASGGGRVGGSGLHGGRQTGEEDPAQRGHCTGKWGLRAQHRGWGFSTAEGILGTFAGRGSHLGASVKEIRKARWGRRGLAG